MLKKELMLYVHIPFCVRKCEYCDFLSGPAKGNEISEYVQAICEEISSYQEVAKDYIVHSLFFGGGTPSMLSGEQIRTIIEALRKIFDFHENAEITIECNPGTLTKNKLSIFKELGINRLSIGLQSTDNNELKLLGRIHTYEEFIENYHTARELGFDNINIDLMSALPGQTLTSYRKTLEQIIALNPEHISAYSLIIEEGTPFFERYGDRDDKQLNTQLTMAESNDQLPGDEVDREMYHLTKQLLKEAGYERYEISNYAKPGFACRHNNGYWERKEYLGIGLGASSFINKKRYRNEDDLSVYLSGDKSYGNMFRELHELSKKEEIEEFMFLGLRLVEGVNKTEFHHLFQRTIEEVYQHEIEKLVKENLIEISNEKIFLTDLGLDLSNLVFSEFILDNYED